MKAGLGLLVRKAIDQLHARKLAQASRGVVIHRSWSELEKDLENGLCQQLSKIEWLISSHFDCKDVPVTVRFQFAYGKEGLTVMIYRIEPVINVEVRFQHTDHTGYTFMQRNAIDYARIQIGRHLHWTETYEKGAILMDLVRQQDSALLHKKVIESPRVDQGCRWYALENVLKRQDVLDVYRACQAHREFFHPIFVRLGTVTTLARKLAEKAKALHLPLCFPTIVERDEHVISFEDIVPIHLLATQKPKDLRRIRSLAPMNSRMLCLTGAHTGGKTTTGLAVLTNLYLAQSGLPVFGKSFKLNVKRMIGIVFIDRGNGSTVELLLQKIRDILLALRHYPGSEVVLIIDEVGTGTQQDDGFALGVELLETLTKAGVSILFSTQILALAEHARDHLGALCYQLDDKHRIKPGINGGQLQTLMKNMGIKDLLAEIRRS